MRRQTRDLCPHGRWVLQPDYGAFPPVLTPALQRLTRKNCFGNAALVDCFEPISTYLAVWANVW